MSAKVSGKTPHEVLVEIDQLSTKLKKNPKNPMYLCKLASLHLDDGKLTRSKPYLTTAIGLYKDNKSATLKQGMELVDVMIKFWKADKYSSKQDLRINLTPERDRFLSESFDILKSVITKQDAENTHLLALKMAYLKECKGEFQGALTLLSELIAAQAMDKVDLSYIIFKAAILLKHMGQAKQAIEYLEFILDDPPTQDGFSKTHVAAFLAHTYEQSGDKYQVFLPKAYKTLQESCAEDMPVAYNKLKGAGGKSKFGQGSELWEMLALQALDRCEYVLAGEFLSEAVQKAPGKGKLIHLLAEVYALLKQRDPARMCAEQAHAINPQSSELRNLLLLVAPEEWTEKLRGLTATSNIQQQQQEMLHTGKEQEGDFDIADEYAPPGYQSQPAHNKTTASSSVATTHSTGGGYSSSTATAGRGGNGGSSGASFGAGTGGISAKSRPPGTNFLSGEKDPAAEEPASWFSKAKARASGALKAIHAGAPIMGTANERAASPAKNGDSSSRPSSPDKDRNGGGGASSPTVLATTERPKSRSSFVSMLFSSTGANKAADVTSPGKPSAGGGANINSSSSSPAKPGDGSSNKKSPAPPTKQQQQQQGAHSPGKPTTTSKTPAVPKVKKVTKYDLGTPSRLSVESAGSVIGPDGAMLVRTTRPEKPKLEKDERKMLDLILSGNENVQIYDPNLAVLHQWRVSNKAVQNSE